jgi:predicted DNA-binding WGR domain protein
MYFTLEMNGRRVVVKAGKKASIGQVTEQAFGRAAASVKDAIVIIASNRKETAEDARCQVWPLFSAKEADIQ